MAAVQGGPGEPRVLIEADPENPGGGLRYYLFFLCNRTGRNPLFLISCNTNQICLFPISLYDLCPRFVVIQEEDGSGVLEGTGGTVEV